MLGDSGTRIMQIINVLPQAYNTLVYGIKDDAVQDNLMLFFAP